MNRNNQTPSQKRLIRRRRAIFEFSRAIYYTAKFNQPFRDNSDPAIFETACSFD
jgi:hypothetical protein